MIRRSKNCSVLVIFITLLIFVTSIPFAVSLNFSFPSFSPNDNCFNFENDSSPARNTIQLTKDLVDDNMSSSIGRVTYKKPMHLWDNATGILTDFTTHFTFVIDSQEAVTYADGIAFFLAPNGSTVPKNGSLVGGAFGLTTDDKLFNTTVNQFVAVEFDIYLNDKKWNGNMDYNITDCEEHVGIDIKSVESVTHICWLNGKSSIMDGLTNEAWISYNSSSQNLSVVFQTLNGTDVIMNQDLHIVVDLREHLPDYVTFGFSAATGSSYAIQRIHSWEFNSTLEPDGVTAEIVPSPSKNNTGGVEGPILSPSKNNTGGVEWRSPSTSNNTASLVVGLIVGVFVFVCACGLGIFVIRKKRNREEIEDDILVDDDSMDGEFEKGIGPKKFSYNALAEATDNFSPQEKLGEGGFGGVYRGFLKDLNSYVAVKRVSRGSSQGIKEYASEVKIISRLRHKNLVQLIGWCHVRKNLLLVYEYMPNGSLDSHLFKGQGLLPWGVRFKIARGLASVLLYLHEEWEQCVVHRDIKSSNIMLDSNFNTKLGDFGLARLIDHDKGAQTTIVAGTQGYMAPECFVTLQASREADVFSFGVVALEIACGRKPIDHKLEENQKKLVKWVWDLYGMEQILRAADPKLDGDYDEEEMKRLMIVGLWCAHPDSTFRPTIRQAIHVINLDVPLPNLPRKMPVATYLDPLNVPFAYTASTSQSNQTQSSGHSNSNNTNSSNASASAALLCNTSTR